MIQYFEEQLKSEPPLSEKDAAEMVQTRVADGGDEAKYTEYFKTKLGKRLCFYIMANNGISQVLKSFEDEIDTDLTGCSFVNMSGTIPKFTK
jgi:hypothetical protein